MKVLITGAAGFVGSTLATRLVEDPGIEKVIGIDSLTDYYDPAIKTSNVAVLQEYPKFEFLQSDLNTTDLDGVLDGVNVIYHQAGQPGVRKSWGASFDSYLSANVASTQRLLEAARNHSEMVRFIYASSSSVYGNSESYPTSEDTLPRPYSPYGVTKLAAEHLVSLYANNYGVPTVSLRYFTVYGPHQRPDMGMHRFISRALNGDPIDIYGDGNQVRDFTYVDDVVRANIAAGAAQDIDPGLVVNICGGSTVTVNEVLDTIEDEVGKPLNRNHMPNIAGDVRKTAGTNDLAAATIGWTPEVGIREGLARHIEALSRGAECIAQRRPELSPPM
ncbi:NAD-dependent epimerase/dehydratase family protein [Gordonia rubripertincta]|uniref:NAD-dependent epimerase/dehydratase family protein n=1 Tax=Gordonia rubripertincta TaxID=36822 RepID=UPI000B8D3431|nr:NAD-dependent epimerase/dehydratase family protein [Gordonia rubripertincta]ASR01954.1 UDP-glucose 4-epimerase [Gordonia rubripertincta]